MNKGIISLILTSVSLIIVVLCFMFPLYAIHYTKTEVPSNPVLDPYSNMSSVLQSSESENNLDFHQTFLKQKYLHSSYPNYYQFYATSIEYSDYKEIIDSNAEYGAYSDSDAENLNNMFSIYNNTFYIFLSGVIFIILALIFTVFSILPIKNFQVFKKMSSIFHIITAIIILTAALYFFISFGNYIQAGFPDSFLSSSTFDEVGEMNFWYSYSEGGLDYSMGPSFGWYFMFIVCILSIISAVLLFLNRQPWIPKNIPSQITPTYQSTYPTIDNSHPEQNYDNKY